MNVHLLNTPPYELYKLLGQSKSDGEKDGLTLPLWNLICDRGHGSNKLDFRSPDNLHSYILDHAQDFPILSAILKKEFSNVKYCFYPKKPSVKYKTYHQTAIIIKGKR